MIRRIILVAAIIVAGIGGGFFYYRFSSARLHVFKITFLDVGQGDSAFIQLGNGENMLVDCGADRTVLSGLGEALPFYYRTIDYLLISHFDLDHYGGCIDVLKRYKVKRLITNGEIKRSALSVAWQSAVDTEHMSAIIIERTSTLLFGDVRLEFLSPDRSLEIAAKDLESSNNQLAFSEIANGKYRIEGEIDENELILVQMTYVAGWQAKDKLGRNLSLWKDPLGFILIKPANRGSQNITLTYHKPVQIWLGYLITAATIAGLLITIVRTKDQKVNDKKEMSNQDNENHFSTFNRDK